MRAPNSNCTIISSLEIKIIVKTKNDFLKRIMINEKIDINGKTIG